MTIIILFYEEEQEVKWNCLIDPQMLANEFWEHWRFIRQPVLV